jgi:predicted nucleic acid-binding protein
MPGFKKVYWDTSIFISYLSSTHPAEVARAEIAEDILKHARAGDLEVWTSVWTIVETIRPKSVVPENFPLPIWAGLLNAADKDGALLQPTASVDFAKIWTYFKRNTLPARLIPEADAQKIKDMFDWPWIKKIDIVPAISHRAAEIARAHNMKGGDSLHVASALHRQCEVLQRWDRDYQKTNDLIPSQDPERMSSQASLGLS